MEELWYLEVGCCGGILVELLGSEVEGCVCKREVRGWGVVRG